MSAPPHGDTRAERGAQGEDRAVELLRELGYRIVARNFRCKLGELDIVARDGDVLVFVEVRTRAGGRFGSAVETVTRRKRERLALVASAYLSRHRPRFTACRFDVVGITGERIEHVRDAFRLGLDL